MIEVTDSKMITIGGGKWTTYRHMAEETVDKAVEVCGLKPLRECVTAGLLLEGGHDWHPLMYIHLVQDYGLEVEVSHQQSFILSSFFYEPKNREQKFFFLFLFVSFSFNPFLFKIS